MTQVKHYQFGLGTVISNDAKSVKVSFNGDIKNILVKYANLKNIDNSNFVLPKNKKIIQINKEFKGVTDDQYFKGQHWYESHKEQSDLDCFIEAAKDSRSDVYLFGY